ncbi:unnamed protein product [Linum trigynum]|uniref:Uncharacterized protein n=1 Tax=Linum trigynum TaxID=586398 RepID=A0AAV2G8A9_9ROSI
MAEKEADTSKLCQPANQESQREKRIEIKMLSIRDKLEQILKDRDSIRWKLEGLKESDRGFRFGVIDRKKKLDLLQQSLDKLSFANRAYQDRRSIRSTTMEKETHYHKTAAEFQNATWKEELGCREKTLERDQGMPETRFFYC